MKKRSTAATGQPMNNHVDLAGHFRSILHDLLPSLDNSPDLR